MLCQAYAGLGYLQAGKFPCSTLPLLKPLGQLTKIQLVKEFPGHPAASSGQFFMILYVFFGTPDVKRMLYKLLYGMMEVSYHH